MSENIESELLDTLGFNSWFNRYRTIELRYKSILGLYMEANELLTSEVGRRLAVTTNPFKDKNISLGEVWLNSDLDGVRYELIYNDPYETYCCGEGEMSMVDLEKPVEEIEKEYQKKKEEKIKTIEENIDNLRKTDYTAYEMLMERIRR